MKKRFFNWLLVAAGLLGPAAPALRAQGIIVTALPVPLGMSSDLFSIQYPIDIDSDSVPDFTFGADPGFIGLRTERANQVIVRLSPPPNISGPVAKLVAGFQIGSSLDPQLAWNSSDPVGGYVSPGEIAFATIAQHLSTGSLSEWPGSPGARGFIGIQFEQPDGFHYGYFDVHMSAEGGGVLLGWAYNSVPNASLIASPVPEPSTWALLGTGELLLWWYGRREKRS
ncbi:MAG TPA: PEP-CTERM sorting domain-containing protein [Verrucomicrobiota bacterium]|nr:PEP-CTERM sorting domain-containing protein [Verrucomicrobiota bacterium]HQL78144.1 PEP-CTERM sorting domain-containing protein [Verrucomicrobiota bacterium]